MKGYGQLTLAQLRIFVRNRQVIFWTMAFPIFLMLMLGSFIGKSQDFSFQGFVIDQDQTPASQQFIEQLFAVRGSEKLKMTTDLEFAMNALHQGDQQLLVVIPEGYEAALESGEQGSQAKIYLYYDETNRLAADYGTQFIGQIVDNMSKQLTEYVPLVTLEAQGVQSQELQYIDFLVPGIVAMMIMSNNLNGVAGQIASWRERGILRRMQSTTLNASTFIAAQITARLLLNGLQAVLVLLVGNLVFGTQVNGSWLLLLLFVVLGTLAFMSIGFIIAGLAKTPESAGPIAGFISFPLLFLGGVFFPIDSMPKFLQPIVHTLPIAQLSTALRQVMNIGADLSVLWSQTLFLCLWTIGAFIVASFTFKWE